MSLDRHLPFIGRLVWLIPEQGGRASGPASESTRTPYAPNAYVPPDTVTTGIWSVLVDPETSGALTTSARVGWLVKEDVGQPTVVPGTVMVITEGTQEVAYFHVSRVDQ
jgi:hypothetical protein